MRPSWQGSFATACTSAHASDLLLTISRDRLAEVWRQMAEEREAALQRVAPSAFVTFRTREAQVVGRAARCRCCWVGLAVGKAWAVSRKLHLVEP